MKKLAVLLLLACACHRETAAPPPAATTTAPPPQSHDAPAAMQASLFRFSANGKVGFIDRSGKTVIEPQFDEARDFSESLAAVRIDQHYGYIDTTGHVVINPIFDGALDFSEGLAPVLLDTKWGFINRNGAFVLRPQYDAAEPFRDGRAAVRNGGREAYIDTSGRPVFEQVNDEEYARQTIADMRRIAAAWEARATDVNKYHAAGAFTDAPYEVPAAQLQSMLAPTYMRSMPITDGWGFPFSFRSDARPGDPRPAQVYEIRSMGRDGRRDGQSANGATTNFDCDIVYSNGMFLQYPAGTSVH